MAQLAAHGVEGGHVASVQLPEPYETVVVVLGLAQAVGAVINNLLAADPSDAGGLPTSSDGLTPPSIVNAHRADPR